MKKQIQHSVFIENKLSRLFDIVFSLVCLIILSPLFIIIGLMIKLESRGPILFKQKRVGQYTKPFYIYKFRSMYLHDEKPLELGPIKHNHTLVTRAGYIIRRFKLDELPQFINVLVGEMSLIGPRPCLFDSIETLSLIEKRRFNVLPGITGWAEVNGNVELTWSEQLLLDLWYVDHVSFKLKIIILMKTMVVIVLGSVKNQTAIHQAMLYANSFHSNNFN